MTLLVDLAAWSVLAFGLLLVVQLLVHEAGDRLGRRITKRGEVPPEGVGVVVGGLLALLAFVLA